MLHAQFQNLLVVLILLICSPSFSAWQFPNDPLVPFQWSIVDIMADKAWENQVRGDRVVVAVLDSGIQLGHADLKNKLWVNLQEYNGETGIDDDSNGYIDDIHGFNFIDPTRSPNDDNGHGTHCAGIIGAESNNGIGIAGISSHVRLMAVKTFDHNLRAEASAVAAGIDYAVKNGADIINASFGSNLDETEVKAALKRAENAGILVVTAAGNFAKDIDEFPYYPASYDFKNIITVGAIDRSQALWLQPGGGSNFGRLTVDLVAPGVDIISTHIDPSGYKIMRGTSQAAPMVSGVAAVVKSLHPEWRAEMLRDQVARSAERRSYLIDRVRTGSALNAYRAATDQVVAANPNNPAEWSDFDNVSLASPHPLKPESDLWSMQIQGKGVQMALFFSKIKLMDGDKIEIYNTANNELLETFKDYKIRFWTRPLSAKAIKIVVRTNRKDSQSYGFEIRRVAYK